MTKPSPAEQGAQTWQELAEVLRQRDHDPKYADAPVLDAYARISKSPEGDLEKTDRQLLDILTNIAHRKVRLGEVLRDDNLSAWKTTAKGRPRWNTLVQRLESRDSDGVVAWHTDRLMRQPRDLERLIDFGEKHGLIVGSCHGDYSLDSQDDLFVLRVLTAAAAKASGDTSRRQKRKAESMREAGRPSGGGRPFGMPGKLNGSDEDVPAGELEDERAAIAWAVRAHLDGVSLYAIAEEWNARGLRTTSGKLWEQRQLRQVLTAPRVAGLLAYKGNVVGRLREVEPIVSEDDRKAIVSTFQARRRGRPVTEPYLLSGGHLICARCEQRLSGKMSSDKPRADGQQRRRYVCRPRGEGCGKLSIDAVRVEKAVRDMVIRELSNPKHARQIARTSAKLAEVEAKLKTVNDTIKALARRAGEGYYGDDLDEYDAAVEPLKVRREKLKAERDALRDAGAGEAVRTATAEDLAAEWDDPTTSVEVRRTRVRAVAPRGILVLPEVGRTNQHTDVLKRLRVR